MIMSFISMYALFGAMFMVVYMIDVGKLISKKYGCSLMDGIFRFEQAGTTISNIAAVLIGMIMWPRLWWSMKTGIYQKCIHEMVEENEY